MLWYYVRSSEHESSESHSICVQHGCYVYYALTRRYPNNSFFSWLLSSLSFGGCFLRNLNIAVSLICDFLPKTKQHSVGDATPTKDPKSIVGLYDCRTSHNKVWHKYQKIYSTTYLLWYLKILSIPEKHLSTRQVRKLPRRFFFQQYFKNPCTLTLFWIYSSA